MQWCTIEEDMRCALKGGGVAFGSCVSVGACDGVVPGRSECWVLDPWCKADSVTVCWAGVVQVLLLFFWVSEQKVLL